MLQIDVPHLHGTLLVYTVQPSRSLLLEERRRLSWERRDLCDPDGLLSSSACTSVLVWMAKKNICLAKFLDAFLKKTTISGTFIFMLFIYLVCFLRVIAIRE